MRRIASPIAATLIMSATMACGGSTHYVPQRPGHVHLVMKDGEIALFKDRGAVAVTEPIHTLMGCDDTARQLAVAAARDTKDGRQVMFAASVIAPYATPLAGWIVHTIGRAQYEAGLAGAVDAMNRHNDVETCVAAASSHAKKE